MNKSLEAFLRGYIYFKVNDKKFLLYNSALQYRKTVKDEVIFIGFHIIKAWQCFYIRYFKQEDLAFSNNQCPTNKRLRATFDSEI